MHIGHYRDIGTHHRHHGGVPQLNFGAVLERHSKSPSFDGDVSALDGFVVHDSQLTAAGPLSTNHARSPPRLRSKDSYRNNWCCTYGSLPGTGGCTWGRSPFQGLTHS